MKSALFKMNFKELQPYQYKTTFANILKPCQTVLNELLTSIEEMVNTFGWLIHEFFMYFIDFVVFVSW